jgi:hypothetical protein
MHNTYIHIYILYIFFIYIIYIYVYILYLIIYNIIYITWCGFIGAEDDDAALKVFASSLLVLPTYAERAKLSSRAIAWLSSVTSGSVE